MLRPLAALALLALLCVPPAAAEVREFALSKPMEGPVAIVAAEDGSLWVTLDGAWAIARIEPFGGAPRMWPLAEPRVDEHDSLYGLVVDSDGNAWTASRTHLHRVHPSSGDVEAIPFGRNVTIVGGLSASPAAVYVGLPAEDAIASYLRGPQRMTSFDMPQERLGPLEFATSPDGVTYFTATYGNTYGWIERDGTVAVGPAGVVQAPTGIAFDAQGRLWMGEHGGSAVVTVDPATRNATRYPTAPSPYYPISGPSGIHAAPDGAVWTVLHFSDRVARLDPANRTLVEYELPSSPVTNAQHLALTPDGAAWVAEREKDRLARVTYGGETPAFSLAPSVEVAQRGRASVAIEGAPTALVVGTGLAGLNATVQDGALVVEPRDVPPGEYLVLVSDRVEAKTWVGRYVAVTVTPAAADETPAPPAALVLPLLGLVALALRASRRRAP